MFHGPKTCKSCWCVAYFPCWSNSLLFFSMWNKSWGHPFCAKLQFCIDDFALVSDFRSASGLSANTFFQLHTSFRTWRELRNLCVLCSLRTWRRATLAMTVTSWTTKENGQHIICNFCMCPVHREHVWNCNGKGVRSLSATNQVPAIMSGRTDFDFEICVLLYLRSRFPNWNFNV